MSQPDPELERELQNLKAKMGLNSIKATPAPLAFAATPRQRGVHQSHPALPWNRLKILLLASGSLIALLWLANLPYPFIRSGVERAAPILLLPTYASWDFHYRRALPLVGQAEQLINRPTTPGDLDLGAKILAQAKTHVEGLPVTFFAQSSVYRSWYRHTHDQFRNLRTSVGQMEAKLFQEQQSQIWLNQAEAELTQAQTQYQQAATELEKSAALRAWAVALNQFQQISPETLAGKNARIKLKLYETEHLQLQP